MWNRAVLLALFSLTTISFGLGQNRDVDSQTLRDILTELRAIHNDIRINETTQLLVAELQLQQNVVNRATENTDNARSKLDGIHRDQKSIAIDLQHNQEMLDKSTSEDEKKGISEAIERTKSNGAALKAVEHDLNTELVDKQQRLETAQTKLDEIENELKTAISRLQPVRKDGNSR
jgi:chromosome segregation ATPase